MLYIVGGCCELNWNYWDESNKRFIPNPDNPEELIWEGPLRIGSQEEPNRFKILTAESWTEETFHPYISDALAEGISEARISGGDDLKWTIEKDGVYRLTLNTKNETLKSEYFGVDSNEELVLDTSTASISDTDAVLSSIYVSNRTINVDGEVATDVIVSTVTGQTVICKSNHISGPVAGNLPCGIYLVSINGKTAKVLVR